MGDLPEVPHPWGGVTKTFYINVCKAQTSTYCGHIMIKPSTSLYAAILQIMLLLRRPKTRHPAFKCPQLYVELGLIYRRLTLVVCLIDRGGDGSRKSETRKD